MFKLRSTSLFLFFIFALTAINAQAQTTYYPARGVFNGFLRQTNIVECDNNNSSPITVQLTLTASSGAVLAVHAFPVAAFGSMHTILNDLADIVDNHGTYTLSLGPGQDALGDKLNCRTVFYRPALVGAQKDFEYAFSLPVQNAQSGILSGVYNSFDPSGGDSISNNWLSIVNFDPSPFSANVSTYNSDGSLDQTIPIVALPAGARVDIALGHPKGQVTGLYVITPTDNSQRYDAVLVRYNQSTTGDFNFAFPLKATSGSCTGQPVLASTMGNGLTKNWLEIANANDIDITVTVEVRDRFGALVHTERPVVLKKSQYHVFLSDKIDPTGVGNVGSARIICDDPTDKLIIQSTFYGSIPGSFPVEWAYSTQELGRSPVSANATISAPANTFVGMANWFKFADASLAPTLASFNLYDQAGQTVAAGDFGIDAGGTADLGIHSMLGADKVGSVVVNSNTSSASYSGEMLRVLSRDDGEIGNIISIPGIVQQDGLSDGSFKGDPQSLAKYRDKLTSREAQRLLTITSFGGPKTAIDQIVNEGLAAAVDRLTTVVAEPQSLVTEAENWLDGDAEADGPEDFNTQNGVKYRWLTFLLKSPNPLKEKMSLFWHDRFASSCRVLNNGVRMGRCVEHMQRFRTHALGSYRALLREMTTDYLMLVWLNGELNEVSSPDENYGRELLELFSMGEAQNYGAGLRYPLYTEEGEIREFARTLTGYIIKYVRGQNGAPDNWVVEFVPERHDDGVKTFWPGTPYETSGNFVPTDAPDIVLGQRPNDVGRYIGGGLFTMFCHDHPSEQLKAQMASILISSNWNVLPLVKRILQSEACFSPDAHKSRVMDPITFAIGFLKRTGIPMRVDRLARELERMGFDITDPVDVFGWAAGFREKEHQETTFWNAFPVEYANFLTEALRRHKVDFVDSNGDPIFDFCSLNPSDTARSDQVVDHLSTLLGTTFSAAERTQYIRYLDNRSNGLDSNGVPIEQVRLYDAQVPSMCEEKLGGVLWMSTLNPSAMTY